ncbi:hypothetical protein BLA29_001142 [Euroglyphus maynei]|uniref:Uncharacterized protein n=1 Tax=Euroglyphus maynei TaxID=6958 RepID=A0A1Y3B2Y3_EURMA|nr:hypothetical protein BLA29_001142 [Euroglyphus maynei]
MHAHHQLSNVSSTAPIAGPSSSSSSASSSLTNNNPSLITSSQRDRERQREREQRRQQALALSQTVNNQPAVISSVGHPHPHHNHTTIGREKNPIDKTHSLFPDPVRLEREDDTTKEIRSTLGDFFKFVPFLNNSTNYSDCINSNLVGISRNEFNRRRVQEIFAEMIPNQSLLPSKPITGLDDLYNDDDQTMKEILRLLSETII